MGWLRHPGILTAALVVAGLLLWGFWPRPVPVEMVTAGRGPLRVTIDEDGRTRVIDRYEIRAPVAGVACRVDLDVGDPVSKDQVLLGITPLQSAVLDPRSRAEAEARVAAAEAALASTRENAGAARARAEYRRAELARVEPLAAKGVVSREALDQTRMERLAADAALRAAEHAVSVARYELEAARTALAHSSAAADSETAERVPVRAPIDGRVLAVQRECEGPVSLGELLLVVGDPSRLEVEVDLLSADAVRVQPGTRVLFEQWGGEQPLEGVVRTVEPVGFTKVSALGVEEQRVLVIADFTSPAARWQRLGDGYRVEARFVLWQADDVLQVPASSLFRPADPNADGWSLFRVEDGRARLHQVEVGRRTGLRAQITAGLEPGDAVIDHPSDDVTDGVRVKAR
ncbi:HlyD family efflux transporter periplasmic adaptor subunit [uncultured Thiohalocapsa sp.]|uniref:efflux RND transporter periplasmic adaptor subunit n=1 Tax=uncultured Thiohalocapsa sp. TaxID=768990 RepID=UPI0025E949E7|nr:HlyD family efflux transporter periplasmic adaptor subunit [uncultured Thiohalocapsa sp.]